MSKNEAGSPESASPVVRVERPMQLILMGVSGCGKSTVGRILAGRLGWDFADADDFHPEGNVAKMAAGVALTDDDRKPWLEELRLHLAGNHETGISSVLACSALKSAYRKQLAMDGVRFVYLSGSKDLIAARLARRSGHYMPKSLLESQFAALEEPQPGENILTVDIDRTPEAIALAILAHLKPHSEK